MSQFFNQQANQQQLYDYYSRGMQNIAIFPPSPSATKCETKKKSNKLLLLLR